MTTVLSFDEATVLSFDHLPSLLQPQSWSWNDLSQININLDDSLPSQTPILERNVGHMYSQETPRDVFFKKLNQIYSDIKIFISGNSHLRNYDNLLKTHIKHMCTFIKDNSTCWRDPTYPNDLEENILYMLRSMNNKPYVNDYLVVLYPKCGYTYKP